MKLRLVSQPLLTIFFPFLIYCCQSPECPLPRLTLKDTTIVSDTTSPARPDTSDLSRLSNLFDVTYTDENTFFVCGDSGGIFKTTDKGKIFKKLNSGTKAGLYGVAFRDKNNGFIAGDSGILLRTRDAGATWKKVTKFTDVHFRTILFRTPLIGFIGGYTGEIWKTSDGGESWENVATPSVSILYSLLFLNDSVGFSAGEHGKIFKTTDDGVSWILHPVDLSPSYNHIADIYFWNENEGFFVGGNADEADVNFIFTTTNSGETWTRTFNHPTAMEFINAIEVTKDSTCYLFGGLILHNTSYILKSTDKGKSWQVVRSKYPRLTASCITPEGHIYVVGLNGTFFNLL